MVSIVQNLLHGTDTGFGTINLFLPAFPVPDAVLMLSSYPLDW